MSYSWSQDEINGAEFRLTRAKKSKLMKTLRTLARGSEGERRNAANILSKKGYRVPRYIIKYVEDTKDADTAIVIMGEKATSNKYSTKIAKIVEEIKSNQGVREKEAEIGGKRKRTEEKVGVKKTKFDQVVDNLVKKATETPKEVTEIVLDETNKELIALNPGINTNVIIEMIRGIKQFAESLDGRLAQNAIVKKAIGNLEVLNFNEPSELASHLVNLLTTIRNDNVEYTKKLVDDANNNMQIQISKVNQDLASANEKIAGLTTDIRGNNELIAGKEQQMKQLAAEFRKLQNELENSKRTIDQNSEEFQKQMEEKRNTLEVLTKSYKDLNNEKLLIEQSNKNLIEDKRLLEENCSKIKEQLHTLKNANETISAQYRVQTDKVKSLELNTTFITAKMEELQKKLDDSQQKIDEMQQENAKKSEELKEEQSISQAKQVEIDQLHAQYEENMATIRAKDDLIQSLQTSKKEYSDTYKNGLTEAEKDAVVSQLKTANNEIDQLKRSKADLEQANTQLQASITAYKAEQAQLAAKSHTLQQQLDSLGRIKQIQDNELQESKSHVLKLKIENDQYRQQLAEQANKIIQNVKEIQLAEITAAKTKAESLELQDADPKVAQLTADYKATEELEKTNFIAPLPQADEYGDIVMDGDALTEIGAAESTRLHQPIPSLENIQSIFSYAAHPSSHKEKTPHKIPQSLANKKRSLGLSGGAYLVGGRPDPDFAVGKSFWKNAYNKGFKLF